MDSMKRLETKSQFPEECGYRWSDGSDGRPKSWYVDVGASAVDDEFAFLKAEICLRDVEPRLQTLTVFTRFSGRI